MQSALAVVIGKCSVHRNDRLDPDNGSGIQLYQRVVVFFEDARHIPGGTCYATIIIKKVDRLHGMILLLKYSRKALFFFKRIPYIHERITISLKLLKMVKDPNTIWTIGHSTHPIETFINMLRIFDIEVLADVRSFPGSRKYPHFNKENLAVVLPEHNISYVHIATLGGRRKANPDSVNTGWRHPAFRGYADYMASDGFSNGIDELTNIAARNRTAMMCSESLWWRCHRSLIADYLKVRGWLVIHILSNGKAQEHPFTAPAKVVDGKLMYTPTPGEA